MSESFVEQCHDLLYDFQKLQHSSELFNSGLVNMCKVHKNLLNELKCKQIYICEGHLYGIMVSFFISFFFFEVQGCI